MSKRSQQQKKVKVRKRRAPKERLSEEDNQFCWDLSRAFSEVNNTKKEKLKPHMGDPCWCSECKRRFCLGGDYIDVYCIGCFLENCCKKDFMGERLCQRCGRTT